MGSHCAVNGLVVCLGLVTSTLGRQGMQISLPSGKSRVYCSTRAEMDVAAELNVAVWLSLMLKYGRILLL